MISFENGMFSLAAESFSYMFRVTDHGQLEHLHFGAPVQPGDAQALACKPGTGWGSSVNYAEDGTCLDILPFEWSGSGRGDYRESPIALDMATDFVYQSHVIHQGAVTMACGLPQAQDVSETLEIILKIIIKIIIKILRRSKGLKEKEVSE